MRILVFLLLAGAACTNANAANVGSVDRLVLELDQVQIGDVIEVDAALLGDVISGTVELERIEIRAPGAKVYVERDGRLIELDHPRRKVFMGRATEASGTRIGLLFDPVGLRIDGAMVSDKGMHSLELSSKRGWRIEARSTQSQLPEGTELVQTCGNINIDQSHRAPRFDAGVLDGALSSVRGGSLRYGVLALDTDTEWLDQRFGDDETAALEWMEELLLATNAIFETQLNLRMLQGHTILRTETDPYNEETSGTTSAHLQEFGDYWANNYGHISRTHAALISGNSDLENSASGIAWVNSYCEEQSNGGSYSVNQLFWGDSIPALESARLFAHELGHNLGSVHTHCYSPPIDHCWSEESGCFSGTTSCPAEGGDDVPGTLMSYCNLNGCGSNKMEFAPEVDALLNQAVDDNTPSCLATTIDDFIIFEDRFQF
jgi:hypothetical protein